LENCLVLHPARVDQGFPTGVPQHFLNLDIYYNEFKVIFTDFMHDIRVALSIVHPRIEKIAKSATSIILIFTLFQVVFELFLIVKSNI
jgi:hypothetical protein